jgi:Protein of unknown function (DUF3626)
MAIVSRVFQARCAVIRSVSEFGPTTATRLLPTPDVGWCAGAVAAHLAAAQSNAVQRGLSTEAYVTAVDQWLKYRVRRAEVRVRIRQHHLLSLLTDERYLTQFEVGHSGGAFGQARRIVVEHTVLGVPPSCLPRDRPVYGYLSGSDESGMVGQYGDVILRLRPSVRCRATFVVGDSLDYAIGQATGPVFVPQPVLRPRYLALIAPTDPLDCNALADASPLPYRYAEAQIYGGVRPADIVEVIFTPGIAPEAATKNLLQIHELPWKVV